MSEMVTRGGFDAEHGFVRLRFRRSTLLAAGAAGVLTVAAVYSSWPSKKSVEQIEAAIEREIRRIDPYMWDETESCLMPLGGAERRACAKINSLRRALDAAEAEKAQGSKSGSAVSEHLLLASIFIFWASAMWWSWKRASGATPPQPTREQPSVERMQAEPDKEPIKTPQIIDVTPRVIQIEHHPEDVKEFDRWANDKHTKC